MRRPVGAVAASLLALALASCATGAPMTPGERPPFRTTAPGPIAPGTTAPGPSGAPSEVPAARWAAIVDDLAARGVTGTAALVSAERVTFSDGSLGCPTPGHSYTQAIVEGMRVIVQADGMPWDYRFGNGDRPRLCER